MVRALVRAAVLALLLLAVTEPSAQAATTAQRLVSVARAELAKGVREIPDGSNRAPAISRYVASTTPSWLGAPWCAYFVSYVARRSGVPIGPSGRGLGYVPYIVQWAKRTGRWRSRPRPGYLVTWPNHVGIVESVSADGRMTTIEGNAGNAVRRRWRRTSDAQGFVALAAGGPVTRRPVRRKPKPARREAALKARITLYPSARVRVGERLELSANDSSGPVDVVRWDLDGDGRFDDARGDTASVRVVRAGRFPVAVRVTSPRRRHAVARATVTVLGASAPTARLRLPAQVAAGTPVTADASASSDPAGRGLRFEWDVDGDGSFTPGGARETVSFAAPGVHAVAVRAIAADGQVDETTRPVTVTPAAAPAVAVTCEQASVPTGTGVACTADTSGSTSRIARVEWDVDGDGRFLAAGVHTRWAWSTPGRRVVRVRVSDRDGRRADAATEVDVTNRAPTPVLRVPARATAGERLELDASGSTDPDGRVVAVRWDVGGDGWDADGPKAAITPAAPGRLRVVVEVRDDAGATARAEAVVDVGAPPTAVIDVLTAQPLAGDDVVLTGRSSSSASPLRRCLWDIDGDGRTDLASDDCSSTIRVRYRRAGTKLVTLTVVDADGRRATTETRLVVG